LKVTGLDLDQRKIEGLNAGRSHVDDLSDADIAELLNAAGAEEVFLVRLEAEPATLVDRITEREPATWSGLPGLVRHARELALTMPGLSGVDLVLSTEGRRAEDVAARIRAACPDVGRHRSS
jgi:hypothetical protein